MPNASVLVPAYNEEQNIVQLLERIAAESARGAWTLDDVIVVASGCTDETLPRARSVAARHPMIRVVEQAEREGKASAINAGLALVRNDDVVLVSGDVMPVPGTIQRLLEELADPGVGVVGGRPVPLNAPSSFTGFATHLLWRLHDMVSRASPQNPKCGEVIVFRRAQDGRPIVPRIPADSAVDEVAIQAVARAAGLRSRYVVDAVVNNWGPESVRDWFAQRRRINAGHILARRAGFQPSTMRASTVIRCLLTDQSARRHPLWTLCAVSLEVAARIYGYLDVARGHGHTVWRVASSTKRTIEAEVR
jgi:cellulose synthase/poly-beta-1,6-N-acetylglucosamine synthase-like glycosyltransferase